MAITISTEDGLGIQKAMLPTLLPHLVFAELFKHPLAWRRSILGDDMNPEEFWKRMEHVPYMQGHPVLAQVAAPVARVSPEAGSAPAPVARVSPEAGAASAEAGSW